MELYDSGCVMTVSEGHIAYGLSNGGAFFYGCFNVGQTIQGRFVGNRVEILATDKKGRKKGYKYMIVSQSTF